MHGNSAWFGKPRGAGRWDCSQEKSCHGMAKFPQTLKGKMLQGIFLVQSKILLPFLQGLQQKWKITPSVQPNTLSAFPSSAEMLPMDISESGLETPR